MLSTGTIVFVRTDHVYDSYIDFYRLIEASKFQIISLSEIDLEFKNTTYITTPWNGETAPALLNAKERARDKRAKVVWWCLERDVCDGRPLSEDVSLVDDIWVSDRSFADMDPTKFRHVVMGGHPALGKESETKEYDICHLSYLWGRRLDIVNRLIGKFKIAPEAYGKEQQDKYVATSKLMLNMHQYDKAKIVSPLRFAIAASYKLPVLTEEVTNSFPLYDSIHYASSPYDSLVETASQLVASPQVLKFLGDNLHEALTNNYRFDRSVLSATKALWNSTGQK